MSPESPKKPIDPALQETDSSLLESIVSKPPLILNPKLDDTGKELREAIKRGTRIADSILQKFNSIKNNIETKTSVSKAGPSGITTAAPVEAGIGGSNLLQTVPDTQLASTSQEMPIESKEIEDVIVKSSPVTTKAEASESRRKRRAISKAIIEDSESDTTDSENLVIGLDEEEEDDDSQTNSSDNKPLVECKTTDSINISFHVSKTVKHKYVDWVF